MSFVNYSEVRMISHEKTKMICEEAIFYLTSHKRSTKEKKLFGEKILSSLIYKRLYMQLIMHVNFACLIQHKLRPQNDFSECNYFPIFQILNKEYPGIFHYKFSYKQILRSLSAYYNKFFLFLLKFYKKENRSLAIELAQYAVESSGLYRSDLNWFSGEIIDQSKIALFCANRNDILGSIVGKLYAFKKITNVKDYVRLFQVKMPQKLFYNKNVNPYLAWYCNERIYFTDLYRYWLAIHYIVNFKIWIGLNEASLDTLIIRAILDKTNGITVFRQRSEYADHVYAEYMMPSHIVFAWGSTYEKLGLSKINMNNCVFSIGHIYIKRKEIQKFPMRLSEAFMTKTFKILLLSNVFSDLYAINESQFCEFIDFLFAFIKKNDQCSLMIKVKRNDIGDGLYISNHKEYQVLRREEKIILISEDFLLPCSLVSYVDFVIGIGISSAAYELITLGKKALFYFPLSSGSHYLEKKFPNKFVFNDIGLFFSKLTLALNGDNDIGNFSDCIDDLIVSKPGPELFGKVIQYLINSNLTDRYKVYNKINELVNNDTNMAL